MKPRVLVVDDEVRVLNGLTRHLGDEFDVSTAGSGDEGLRTVHSDGPFAVVLSDVRMPGLSGVEFLARVREHSPDATRMLLTGFADLPTTTAAINDGHVFRFLAKPCPPESVKQAVRDGVRQHELVTAERELVDGTLKGSVKVLSEVLAIVSPVAFGRASRVTRIVTTLAERLGIANAWECELSAMMCCLGCVTLSDDVLQKAVRGGTLTPEEQSAFQRHPQIAASLVSHIPRMSRVAEIIAGQEKQFDGGGFPPDGRRGSAIPTGARLLKLALDFDAAAGTTDNPVEALRSLRSRAHWYDPQMLDVLEAALEEICDVPTQTVTVDDLRIGMCFVDDVLNDKGQLLVAKGHEVTNSVREFLRNYSCRGRVREPFRVVTRSSAG